MKAKGLSILIPARNEMFLNQTIQNILSNVRGDTEVIAVLDGAWADPPIPDDPRVHLIYHSESIGQRAATNEAARFSSAEFIMKCDAHCAFDEGFDVKLMADCEKDWTVIPRMYNLHAFDWQCNGCGHRTYQGPKPTVCEKCRTNPGFEMKIVWQPRWSRGTDFARFDNTLHFQYWGAFKKRPEAQGEIADVMCCVGACWFMRRKRYWEIDGMDELHGSWGQMGVELACKSWLSGGRQVVNKKTWFAHMFRTQQGFSFPYPQSGRQVENARKYSRDLWLNDKWPKQVHKFQWLIDKFSPIPDWPESVNKAPSVKKATPHVGMVYYTHHKGPEEVLTAARRRLLALCNGHDLVSVSLKKPLEGFGRNIVLNEEPGHLAMFKQILAGLEATDADIVFLVEHDVLYHPSHFEFRPPSREVYFYNEHTYKVDASTGQAVFYYCKQTSGLCAYRELLLEHYQKRVIRVEKDGFSRHMGYEPGCHRYPRGVDSYRAEAWMSRFPNVDVRHDKNFTLTRWDPSKFRNKDACLGWKLVDEIPGWGITKNRFQEFLKENVK